mmetsp:Transcript_31239/g.68338  ORF Transcript_31239/g.68338 Transcript_31239/m.68338 type:complete len:201 (+) Transcript_31239:735-1337(+)
MAAVEAVEGAVAEAVVAREEVEEGRGEELLVGDREAVSAEASVGMASKAAMDDSAEELPVSRCCHNDLHLLQRVYRRRRRRRRHCLHRVLSCRRHRSHRVCHLSHMSHTVHAHHQRARLLHPIENRMSTARAAEGLPVTAAATAASAAARSCHHRMRSKLPEGMLLADAICTCCSVLTGLPRTKRRRTPACYPPTCCCPH